MDTNVPMTRVPMTRAELATDLREQARWLREIAELIRYHDESFRTSTAASCLDELAKAAEEVSP